MKKLLFVLTALVGFTAQNANAQNTVSYDAEKKQIIYTEVVQMPGMDKTKLYDKAMIVLPQIYEQVDKKFTTKDPDAGTMMLKCTTRVMLKDPKTKMLVASNQFIKYNLAINFKDGKYKYTFDNFHIDKGGYKYPLEKYYNNDQTVTKEDRAPEKLEFLDSDIKSVIEKLKGGMNGQKVEKKEDW